MKAIAIVAKRRQVSDSSCRSNSAKITVIFFKFNSNLTNNACRRFATLKTENATSWDWRPRLAHVVALRLKRNKTRIGVTLLSCFLLLYSPHCIVADWKREEMIPHLPNRQAEIFFCGAHEKTAINPG